VFTEEQENSLKEYIITASKMHQGKTKKMVREFAYDYAKTLNSKRPVPWDKTEMAGMLCAIALKSKFGI